MLDLRIKVVSLMDSYEKTVDYIHGLRRMGPNPGLKRMTSILKRLNNPEEQFRVIHIAGTNGKGSTSAMIESVLRAAGYNVGLFTSPFLDSFTNRIKINGQDIEQRDLVELVSELRPMAEEEGLTQFEFITTLGLVHFARRKVDGVVLEVGLGGRFDATNAVSKPVLTVITNIGYDHMEVLGDTLAKIAFEKAGIIKPGVPLVTGIDDPSACEVVETRAREIAAPVRWLSRDFSCTPGVASLSGQSFSFHGPWEERDLHIALLGRHQIDNACIAIASLCWLNELGFDVDKEAMREGLGSARWPGRFEVMAQNPLIIMDGAHNTHGLSALRKTLDSLLPESRLLWVAGMMEDKDVRSMLSLMQGRDVRLYACSASLPRARDAASLASAARETGFPAAAYANVKQALEAAMMDSAGNDIVLVAGSLYVISEARAALRGSLS